MLRHSATGKHPRHARLLLPALTLVALLGFTPGVAKADTYTAELGGVYEGTLAPGDATFDGGEFYDIFQVQVQAGQRVRATLRSTAFDAWLQLRLPEEQGGLIHNDSMAEGTTNAQLIRQVATTGTFRFEVTSKNGGERGAYTVAFEVLPATTPQRMPIEVQKYYDGSLTDGDATFDDGEFVDRFALTVKAGDSVTLTLLSTEIDPWLQLKLPEEQGGLLFNDDLNAETRNAQIVHTFKVAGTYTVEATSRTTKERGSYRLEVRAGIHGVPHLATGPREVREGALAAGDDQLSSKEYFDHFIFRCQRGDRIRVLTLSTFDAYLIVRGAGLEAPLENDDASGGQNAMVEFVAPLAGDLEVLVTTASPGQSGTYQIVVEGLSPDPELADNQAGELGDGDRVLRGGEFADDYTFHATQGETIMVTLQSTEFDPYLVVVPPDAEKGETVENDDVAAHIRHARVQFEAPRTGSYELIATTKTGGMAGNYRLWIHRAGGTQSAAPESSDVQVTKGVLSNNDSRLPTGEYADRYSFDGRKGDRLKVSMKGDGFDAYLILVPPVGNQIDVTQATEGNEDATIELELEHEGRYRIIATSFRPDKQGHYTIAMQGVGSRLSGDSSARSSSERNYHAILCGITDYPPDQRDLEHCARDAEKLAGALIMDGVLSPKRLHLLTDRDATLAGIRAAFKKVSSTIKPGDVFFFFFSGHGFRGPVDPKASDEADRRQEYLVAVDGLLADDELKALFATIDAKIELICIDACFAGGFLRDLISEPGRLGLFSSEEDVTSLVAKKFNAGGYLSHFVTRGLRGEADVNKDSIVTAGELTDFLRDQWRVLRLQAETDEGAIGYQHLVIDRGGVQITEPLVKILK